ncbi:MAG: hypothetical protein ABMA64_08295 [Myxococcota bacterium]
MLVLDASAYAVPADLDARWAAVAEAVAARSPVPVPFGPDDLRELASNPVVARRYDTPSGAYATGAMFVDAPVTSVWITLQDAPHDPPSRVSIERLTAPTGVRRVHMTLDLPYPLADRQWVSDVTTNRALYDATGGVVWQRTWVKGDPALATNADPDVVWIAENRGAWTMIDCGAEGTLVLFSVRSVLGGMLPESITNTFALSTLRTAMRGLADRAHAIPEHYAAGHEVISTPTGHAIPY